MMAPSIYKAKGVMELARERVGGSSANRFGGAFALSEYEKTRRGEQAGRILGVIGGKPPLYLKSPKNYF